LKSSSVSWNILLLTYAAKYMDIDAKDFWKIMRDELLRRNTLRVSSLSNSSRRHGTGVTGDLGSAIGRQGGTDPGLVLPVTACALSSVLVVLRRTHIRITCVEVAGILDLSLLIGVVTRS